MIREAKEKSEIMAILNKYKDTFDNPIDSLYPEFLDWPGLINEKLYNAPRFAGSLMGLLERNCLDKNVSDCQSI